MKRFWMRSLTGQLIALVLLALALAQTIFFVLSRSERETILRSVQRDEFLARIASVSRLLATTDETLHPEILRAASTALTRHWLSGEPPPEPVAWQRAAREHLLRALPAGPLAGGFEPSASPVENEGFVTNPRFFRTDLRVSDKPIWEPITANSWPGGRPARLIALNSWNGLGMAVQIRDGLWLQTAYARPDSFTQSATHYYISFGLIALLLLIVAILAARRIGRPLQRLTEAAERLGRGEELEVLPETGPEDIRRTTEAFNRMRARVSLALTAEAVEVCVEDDGPGIPEDDFERVFAPFVRLENSRNRSTGGVGLGLAIARTIVRAHGGDIILANRNGTSNGGLRAAIRLPVITSTSRKVRLSPTSHD